MELQPIGSREAKKHLADLLRRVRVGQGFTITQRGEPVADLVPAGSRTRHSSVEAARRMRTFMLEAPQVEPVDLKTLIDSGRD